MVRQGPLNLRIEKSIELKLDNQNGIGMLKKLKGQQ